MVHVVFQDCSLKAGVKSAPHHFSGRVSGVLEGSSSDRAPLCKYTIALSVPSRKRPVFFCTQLYTIQCLARCCCSVHFGAMSQRTGCERFEAHRARTARVPQSDEKLTIRNPPRMVTHVSHVAMVSGRARAGVRHGGAHGPLRRSITAGQRCPTTRPELFFRALVRCSHVRSMVSMMA